ncbi:MAG: TIGR03118 family protein [Terriglobia bacterium]|nr:TIGR03118 family protein [Terriglobia bacterium]
MFRSRKLLFLLVLAMLAFESVAQTNNSYNQTNLVSDVNGVAQHTDPALVNPWGISFVPGGPFWIANNGTGTSTIYDGSGATERHKVTILAGPNTNGPAVVTGTVANTTTGWMIDGIPSQFLFVSEDGTITGWTGGVNAKIVVNNSATGAVYKGLATGTTATGNFLYATNFSQNRVDVFDRNFNLVHLTGNFSDPDLPAGYAPFGIANVGNNRLVITFAMQDASKKGDVAGDGHGFVDVFDTDGTLVVRFASQGTPNSPWGIAVSPDNFGPFSNAMLIGNFGDGTINAFDLGTHNFLGQLNNGAGRPMVIDGLWGLTL